MVSYKEFLNIVSENLTKCIPEQYRNADVKVIKAEKPGMKPYDAICFTPEGSDVGVCLDVHYIYDMLDSEGEIVSAIAVIGMDIVEALGGTPRDLNLVSEDFDFFCEHIEMELVTHKDVYNIIDNIPHREFGDLIVIYKVVMSQGDNDVLTTVVNYELMRRFDLEEVDLFDITTSRSLVCNPINFSYVRDMFYLATSANCVYGASCILRSQFIEVARETINCNFYIIPFSVRIVLIIKDEGEIMKSLIDELAFNLSVHWAAADERLSKSVYYCDVNKNKITKVEKYVD